MKGHACRFFIMSWCDQCCRRFWSVVFLLEIMFAKIRRFLFHRGRANDAKMVHMKTVHKKAAHKLTVRIDFPCSSRPPFLWTSSQLCIGSAGDNDLVVVTGQVRAHHLLLKRDAASIWVQVLPEAGRIYVNARPVRERAMLRLGDRLGFGMCHMLLCAEEDATQGWLCPRDAKQRCTAALRAVAGPLSGRVLALHDQLMLGLHGDVPLELPQGKTIALSLGWRDGQLWLDGVETVPAPYVLRRNGVALHRSTQLFPGDQIALAMYRFVIDVPGMQVEAVRDRSHPAVLPDTRQVPASSRGEIGWIIVTAALIALGITLLLARL